MRQLQKRQKPGVQATTSASLSTRTAQAAKGARNTPEAQATKGLTGGSNTPEAQATKGSGGGSKNMREAQAAKGARNAPEAQATKGSTGESTCEAQAAKGARNTPESQRDEGIVGGHGNTPNKQHAKASCCRSSGVISAAAKELFRAKKTSSSDILMNSVREYWLDGLDVPSATMVSRGGSLGTPTYIPQNEPHDALIILNIHNWSKKKFQKKFAH